jgi:hypothetical protein
MRYVEGPIVHTELGIAHIRMYLSHLANETSTIEQRQLDVGVSHW